ncbi:MAG: hypothetical protein K9K34_11560, partial [Desulfarculaceae bacterium]|nr:hypothetical protein [Desulfarculaceae bacterium]
SQTISLGQGCLVPQRLPAHRQALLSEYSGLNGKRLKNTPPPTIPHHKDSFQPTQAIRLKQPSKSFRLRGFAGKFSLSSRKT